MFKRVTKIKNFGVFQDYRRSGAIEDFKQLNIIYGWNYSGKTTISRLFSFFEAKEIDSNYESCEFEISDAGTQSYTESNLSLQSGEVRVFNTDFIKRNLKWDGESFDPILLLGKESIEAEQAISERTKKIERIEGVTTSLKTVFESLDAQIEDGLTKAATNVKQKLGIVEAFTKFHFRPIVKSTQLDPTKVELSKSEEEKLCKIATTSEDGKLPKLSGFYPNTRLPELINEVQGLVSQIPQFSKTIEYFRENPEVANWVEAGLPLHKEDTQCKYCLNTISQERRDDLAAHFSEDLRNHKLMLGKLTEELQESKLRIPEYAESDFYEQLRDEFGVALNTLKVGTEAYNAQINELIAILQQKERSPFESISTISTVTDCSETTTRQLEALNNVINKNTALTNDFDENKTRAISKLKDHYALKFVAEIGLAKKEAKRDLYKIRRINLLETKQHLESEILEIEAQISNAQKGREEINKYIQSFLGREEIEVEVHKDGEKERFTLRRGGKKAINLSEGEKTAIAFSFFLTKLMEIDDLKSVVVYIDDPVSSLDSNHIFQVNALLKDFFFHQESANSSWELKCDQLFLSTHNYEFFNLIRDLPLKKEFKEYFYVRRVSNTTATLERLPKAIRNYTSEYHYLFSEIYRFHESEEKGEYEALMNIPNAVRRFVELYTYSKLPGNFRSKVDDRTDKLFGKEKSKRIMKVLHYFSHSNNIERMMKNSELVCDIGNAVADLMDELKKDTLHYDELIKSV